MSPRPPRTSRLLLRRLGVAFALVAASAAVVAPLAAAGEYHVYSCKTPDGRPAPADGWSFDAPAANMRTANSCPGGSLLIGSGPAVRGAGEEAMLSITLPDGLRFSNALLHRETWLNGGTGGDPSATPIVSLYRDSWAYTTQTLLEACALSTGCYAMGAPGIWAPGGSEANFGFAPATKFLGFRAGCRGSAGGYCSAPSGEPDRARVILHRADLTVVDSDAPSVSNRAGTFVDPGPRRGTETLSFEARDSGGGVYQAIVRADDREISRQVLDTNGGRCSDAGARADDLEFLYLQPCPGVVGGRLRIDTTKLPEGQPQVEVEVRDAAGNSTLVVNGRITIDNIPGPRGVGAPAVTGDALASDVRPGDRLVALDGVWEGEGLQLTRRWQRSDGAGWVDIPGATGAAYGVSADDVGRRLRVIVRAANTEGEAEQASQPTAVVESGATVQTQSRAPGAGAPAAATCESCNGAGGDAASGQLVVDREQRTVQVKYGAKVLITGRLVDAEGRPLADASVDVFERIEVLGAPWRQVATVKTDSQGGYVYRPKTTASRALRFAYAAKRGTADYRATRDVTVAVQAGMTARAKKRLVSPSGRIQLVGRVQIEGLPRTGTWVEIQVLDSGVWRTIGTRRTSRTGLWKFNHRLRRSSGVTFKFRARLRVSGELAAAESSSGPVKVRVR